ncbi:MAG: DUF3090 family protein [Actinomycetota bacterium]
MSDRIEFSSVDRITFGAVGPPGERAFYLQARRGDESVTLKVEKEHVVALGRGSEVLLTRLGFPEPRLARDAPAMALEEPFEPAFNVGSMALAYVEDRDLVLIECEEQSPEDEEGDVSNARFWITRGQLEALGAHGLEVAAKGRPICPVCNLPMDEAGHQCFRLNGRRSRA